MTGSERASETGGSFNKVFLIGNLGANPNIRGLPAQNVVSFSLATTERFRDRKGAKQKCTDLHLIATFGRLAMRATGYGAKAASLCAVKLYGDGARGVGTHEQSPNHDKLRG